MIQNPGQSIFLIWGEESGGLGNGSFEYSFGNGGTGTFKGVPMALECELFAMSLNCDSAGGTNTQVVATRNVTDVPGSDILVPGGTRNGTLQLPTPQLFNIGDVLNFRTILAGGASDVVVIAWFRTV